MSDATRWDDLIDELTDVAVSAVVDYMIENGYETVASPCLLVSISEVRSPGCCEFHERIATLKHEVVPYLRSSESGKAAEVLHSVLVEQFQAN